MRPAIAVPASTILALACVLAGCQQPEAPTQAASEAGASAAGAAASVPDAKPGTAIADARLVLPAVRGNPGVLYFTVRNTGTAPVTIAAIHVDGVERTEAHETVGGSMKPVGTVTVPAGGNATFGPGARHVMLFTLSPSLVAGGQTEMTLSFAGGDKLSAPVSIAAAGSAGAMGGMKM